MNLFNHIKSVLEHNEEYFKDGKIFKNKVVEAALKLDPQLLSILLKDERAKNTFFQEVDGVLIFDKIKLQKFVSNKEFLPDSFTAFKNKIGLTANGEYLTEAKEVVLDFPFKDCILEGGQTREDQKSQEIFWNETLAPAEIDRMFEPKVLTNWKRYDKDGEHDVNDITLQDNFIIKGNNLIALHTLKKVYKGKIKLIYIDPPYNTGNDDFGYNDKFNHSSWLTFMKNRLEAAYELLSVDGSIWINIDDAEAHYLKVLCDEIFQRENFVANVIWQKKFAPQNDAKYFSDNHDHILVFTKDKSRWKPNLLPRSAETNARYKNPDEDPRGPWTSGDLTVKTYSAEYDYPITTPSGKVINPPKGVCWRVSKSKLHDLVSDNRVWFGSDGGNVPRLKRFLTEVKDGQTPMTIWTHPEVGHNQEAKQELNKILETDLFKTPKPERLMKRIIEIGSNSNDLVLDFFAGSGTTAATALKLKRRFITIEQMDYIESVTKLRLKKVIEGEQGGISKAVGWFGGGSFVSCELMNLNQALIDQINITITPSDLEVQINNILKKGFLKYQLALRDFSNLHKSIKELSLSEQKRILIESLDKNMLYVSLKEVGDSDYEIASGVKRANANFFSL